MKTAVVKLDRKQPASGKGQLQGLWLGIDADGRPLVDYPGNPADPAPARYLAHALDSRRPGDVGLAVWLDISGEQPLILGLIESRLEPVDCRIDGKRLSLVADQELELRCGPAKICLTRDGLVRVEGVDILSRARAAQKIRGASVQIN
ncbi:MAG: hypothetical protein HYV16_03350 [Gammaproteobacteria bacterium]|nr:hypothetical protein [Gammaproteobacteria bacterium]